jgi:hypothetical protein
VAYGLTLVEVVQYLSFSGSRVYFAADMSEQIQNRAAENKVNTLLTSTPLLNRALKAEWIEVRQGAHGAGNMDSYRNQIGASGERNSFVGYQISFNLPILGIQLPFFGMQMNPPEGQSSFSSRVSSFLLREPSFEECKMFFDNAYSQLIQKNSNAYSRGGGTPVVIMDNGC